MTLKMIDKKEESAASPDSAHLAKMCHHLEEKRDEARKVVQTTFNNLMEALKSREKLLLRQIDAVHSQQMAHVQSHPDPADPLPHVVIKMESEKDISDSISNLGHVGLLGGCFLSFNSDTEDGCAFLHRLEEYQDTKQDHISMIKPVPLDSGDSSEQEAIIRFNCVNLRLCANALNNDNEEHSEDVNNEVKEDLPVTDVPEEERKQSLTDDSSHPAQIQQWLKQISAETETEPSIGEPKHFVVLNNIASETT